MYHYVRDLPLTRYPKIKGRLVVEFKNQLEFLKKSFRIVTLQNVLDACYSGSPLPDNSALLTFDDGYLDHFVNVFPILNAQKIQGCFYPPVKTVMDQEVLDVNKIHFLLASVSNFEALVQNIFSLMDELRSEYALKPNNTYYKELAHASRFDPKEVVFIKRVLQRGLPEKARNQITDRLFRKYVSSDEKAFASELYMNMDHLQCMAQNGMHIGSHGNKHYWMDSLDPETLEGEVDLSVDFLKKLGVPLESYTFCYPYGAYNQPLINLLKSKNFKISFTTEVKKADLQSDNPLALPRLDTNDLPYS